MYSVSESIGKRDRAPTRQLHCFNYPPCPQFAVKFTKFYPGPGSQYRPIGTKKFLQLRKVRADLKYLTQLSKIDAKANLSP
jgi:hypothetical protein